MSIRALGLLQPTFIPTRDEKRARAFYEGALSLRFVSDGPLALVIESGAATIRIVKINNFTPAHYTILVWRVNDVESEVRMLIARGVSFQRYPGMQQDEIGIWESPSGSKVAWFHDPDANVLSLSQH